MKNNKLKIIICLMTMIFLMCFMMSCGSVQSNTKGQETGGGSTSSTDTSTGGDTDTSGSEGKTFTIQTTHKIVGSAWIEDPTHGNQAGMNQFAAETGCTVILKNPTQADQALQNQIIEDAIAQGVDALAVVAIDSAACIPVLQKAKDKGIITVSHESDDLGGAIYYDLEAFDPVDYGEHMMQVLAKAMGEKGDYICFVGSLTMKSHNQFMDAAVAYQKEHYPNMNEVASRLETHEDTKQAHDKLLEALKTYPSLAGSLSCAMTDAPGIGLAVEEKGLIGKFSAVGTSIVSICAPYLENGALTHIMYWSPKDSAYAWNKVAYLILMGQQDQIKTGLDLGIPGYDDCLVKGNVVYGKSWIDITLDNMADYPL